MGWLPAGKTFDEKDLPPPQIGRRGTESKLPRRRPLGSRIRIAFWTRPKRTSLLALTALLWLLWWIGRSRETLTAGSKPGRRWLRFDRERDVGEVVFPPLPQLLDRDRLWPPNLNKPICDLRIYVYDLPANLTLGLKRVSQCRWSAYNSELLLHELVTQPTPRSAPSSALITTDPDEADIFFIPLFPSCYLFDCWVAAGWNKTLRCDVEEKYILPTMDWVKSQGFWNASSGEDHLMVHPMDFIDGYYTPEARQAMNSSTYLVTVGDRRPVPFSQHYRPYRDIVIPSATHLLNSYYLNPMDYLDSEGFPMAKRRGTPAQATPTHVEIWDPSPTLEPGAWGERPDILALTKVTANRAKRTTTAIFRGGAGTPDEGESYGLLIRSLFFPTAENATHPHPGFSALAGYDIAEWSENEQYAEALTKAKFGLAPPGYTMDTTRLWEYLAFGVVPVFIGTGPTGGQVMPFETDFDYSSFSISIPRDRAHLLPEILAGVSEDEYERLRKNVWDVGRLLVLESSRGNVWKWIARELCRMRMKDTGAGDEIQYT